jgi:hypothetical protein
VSLDFSYARFLGTRILIPWVRARLDVDPKPSSPMASMYDLIANIPHETTGASTNAGPSGTSKKDQREEGSTVWKVHVRAGAGGGDQEKWFALQDLDVSEVRKEMVFLGETVVQVSIFCHSKLLKDQDCLSWNDR